MLFELLSYTEELLSLTEQFKDQMESKDRDAWLNISAKVADLREHLENVGKRLGLDS